LSSSSFQRSFKVPFSSNSQTFELEFTFQQIQHATTKTQKLPSPSDFSREKGNRSCQDISSPEKNGNSSIQATSTKEDDSSSTQVRRSNPKESGTCPKASQ
jgi:hypothetical protein